jgi:raffinose/stachyose/melibiose transport system permease protein
MKKKTGARIAMYLVILLLLVIYLAPLFYVFNTSLKTENEFIMDTVGLAKSLNFRNYIDAWREANFSTYVVNSIFYMAVCTTLSLGLAIFLAFPIARKYLRHAEFIYAAFLAGMFLPDGTIPQFKMLSALGLYNTRLGYMLGFIGGGGVALFMFVAYIKGIPKELDEAASMDGCGYFRYMFTILFPLMKPAIASMMILTALNVWNDIIRSIIYLSDDKLLPMTRGLYVFTGSFNNTYTLQTAALIIVAAPIILLYIFLQKYIIDGTLAGGVKG